MDLKETYNKIAKHWHEDHKHDEWWIEGTNLFIQKLPHGAHVLDVGCGSGVKAKYLVDHGLKITGIDISDQLLEIAKRKVPKAKFKELSMKDVDSMHETFGGIFMQASLLHIPKKEAGEIVKKMATKLIPGGLLYIAVKEVRKDRPEEGMEKENDYGYFYERFFSYFTMIELEHYFTDAKLHIISNLRNLHPSGKTVWLQIIGKK